MISRWFYNLIVVLLYAFHSMTALTATAVFITAALERHFYLSYHETILVPAVDIGYSTVCALVWGGIDLLFSLTFFLVYVVAVRTVSTDEEEATATATTTTSSTVTSVVGDNNNNARGTAHDKLVATRRLGLMRFFPFLTRSVSDAANTSAATTTAAALAAAPLDEARGRTDGMERDEHNNNAGSYNPVLDDSNVSSLAEGSSTVPLVTAFAVGSSNANNSSFDPSSTTTRHYLSPPPHMRHHSSKHNLITVAAITTAQNNNTSSGYDAGDDSRTHVNDLIALQAEQQQPHHQHQRVLTSGSTMHSYPASPTSPDGSSVAFNRQPLTAQSTRQYDQASRSENNSNVNNIIIAGDARSLSSSDDSSVCTETRLELAACVINSNNNNTPPNNNNNIIHVVNTDDTSAVHNSHNTNNKSDNNESRSVSDVIGLPQALPTDSNAADLLKHKTANNISDDSKNTNSMQGEHLSSSDPATAAARVKQPQQQQPRGDASLRIQKMMYFIIGLLALIATFVYGFSSALRSFMTLMGETEDLTDGWKDMFDRKLISPHANALLCGLQLQAKCSGGATLCNAPRYDSPAMAHEAYCPYCPTHQTKISHFSKLCPDAYFFPAQVYGTLYLIMMSLSGGCIIAALALVAAAECAMRIRLDRSYRDNIDSHRRIIHHHDGQGEEHPMHAILGRPRRYSSVSESTSISRQSQQQQQQSRRHNNPLERSGPRDFAGGSSKNSNAHNNSNSYPLGRTFGGNGSDMQRAYNVSHTTSAGNWSTSWQYGPMNPTTAAHRGSSQSLSMNYYGWSTSLGAVNKGGDSIRKQ